MILRVPTDYTPNPAGLANWARKIANAINQLLARKLYVVSKTAAYAIEEGVDVVLCDATAAAFTITLPPVGQHSGRHVTVKKVDASANAVTIDGDGAEQIDGAANQTLATQWESNQIVSNGTAWYRL